MPTMRRVLLEFVICLTVVSTAFAEGTSSLLRPENRTIPLQVVGVGMGKTGTTSLHYALEILGIAPVHDWGDLGRTNYPVDGLVEQIILKKQGKYDVEDGLWNTQEQWDQFLLRYAALVDAPAQLFAPELARAYPKTKFILTVRDSPEVWVDSYRKTIYKRHLEHVASWSVRIIKWLERVMGTERNSQKIKRALQWGDQGPKEPEAWWYTEHIELVRKHVPADRLLEFNVKEGWKPLCDFLGKEIPDVPFPRINHREEWDKSTANMVSLAEAQVQRILVIAFVTVVTIGLGVYMVRSYVKAAKLAG
ncbi:hypothetical protein TI39_contig4193g00007 [Zymoseptoria brevis]|uniref:Nad dependent epimerase dehydratase like protein n=1 Tax=Zymoseptoria brevis TaxID=1047168 RepID=A0A0F4GAQ5_9PEZI|nr:hypothetical protein TI39_contig4193g00007 [Zymoseptoria brevis]